MNIVRRLGYEEMDLPGPACARKDVNSSRDVAKMAMWSAPLAWEIRCLTTRQRVTRRGHQRARLEPVLLTFGERYYCRSVRVKVHSGAKTCSG